MMRASTWILSVWVLLLPAVSQADAPATTTHSGNRAARPPSATAAVSSESSASGEAGARADERQRRRAGDEDDGRTTDWLWLEAGAGLTHINLKAIKYDNFLPDAVSVVQTSGGFNVGAGMRFFRTLSVGLRLGYSVFDGFSLGTVGAEAALRIPIGFVEPYVRGGLGYAWTGAADYSVSNLNQASVYGFNAALGVGIDFFWGKYISFGAGMDAYVLNLTRSEFDANVVGIPNVDLTKDGHAIGLAVQGHGHLALHF